LVDKIKAEMDKTKAEFVETRSGGANPAFPANPYDFIGAEHNVRMEFVHNHENFTKDASKALEIYDGYFVLNNKKNIITDNAKALSSANNYYSKVVKDGQMNYEWINSLPIPEIEKQITVLYYTTLLDIDNINLRIGLSKSTEAIVINSDLSADSKERLLRGFAIFRYSSSYWSNFEIYPGLSPLSEAVDAWVTNLCMDGDISIEGMDVTCPGTAYQIGAAFSIVFDILTRI
jgi:hypothetical protein